jgi:hypothetical protein
LSTTQITGVSFTHVGSLSAVCFYLQLILSELFYPLTDF